jgi:hypothetical protein
MYQLLNSTHIFIDCFNYDSNSKIEYYEKIANGDNASVIPEEKRLQIVSQNGTHVLIVMPCSSSVMDESGNTFSIKGPYKLNCKKSQNFSYID